MIRATFSGDLFLSILGLCPDHGAVERGSREGLALPHPPAGLCPDHGAVERF